MSDTSDVLATQIWQTLQVRADGNCYFVTRPDFVNLQESPSVWYTPGQWQYDIIREWFAATPLAHLPWDEVFYIFRKLYPEAK